ncbi:MAG: hypothetical protein GX810_01070 [Clostridiales bacterium]|jgi:hypothetical protein|nr:hypothetical protein [Clostridiales bacterium]NLM85544.1 hypothetical protein [Clostridiales bacterium]
MAGKAKTSKATPVEGATYVLQAGKPIYVKTADLCAMTGKSNQWIGQLTAQGILNKEATEYGSLYDLRTNIKYYCDMLEARSKKTDSEVVKVETDKSKAEMQLKQAKAAIAIMEANELKGKMHRSEDVLAITEDLVFAIRNMLVALPGRLAVEVSHAEDAAQAAIIIRTEVNKVMEELANYEYDPKRYEELVRKRQSWEALDDEED